MQIFRLHVRPYGGEAGIQRTFAYCIASNILGVGWRTTSNTNTNEWDVYYDEAKALHENLNICKYIKNNVSPDDLVWTRDDVGTYYLAKVKSGWEYYTTEDSITEDIDIGNIFRVQLVRLDSNSVPGKVIASFRASRTMQRINDETTFEYSKYIWNVKNNQEYYNIDRSLADSPNIFSLLDAEEVEDIVFLYLQYNGWLVVPSSRKADTMSFEYTVINRESGAVSRIQIKTGHTALNRDDFSQFPFNVILFQSQDIYLGQNHSNVTCIGSHAIKNFINQSIDWLPERLKIKLAMFEQKSVEEFKT